MPLVEHQATHAGIAMPENTPPVRRKSVGRRNPLSERSNTDSAGSIPDTKLSQSDERKIEEHWQQDRAEEWLSAPAPKMVERPSESKQETPDNMRRWAESWLRGDGGVKLIHLTLDTLEFTIVAAGYELITCPP